MKIERILCLGDFCDQGRASINITYIPSELIQLSENTNTFWQNVLIK